MIRIAAWIAVVVNVSLCGFAAAQDAPLGEFSVQRFSPTPGPGNYLGVWGGRVYGHLVPSVGVTVDYSHDPFTVFSATCADETQTDCEVVDATTRLVRYQFTTNLHASLSFIDRVDVSLTLPLVLTSGEEFSFTSGDNPVFLEGGTAFAVGDPRLAVRVNAFRSEEDDGVSLAALAFVTAPLGQVTAENRYVGNDGPTAGGFLIAEFTRARLHLAVNFGGAYRKSTTLLSTEVGSALMYRAALGYDATDLLMIFGELEGTSSFSSELDENPLEGRLGVRLQHGDYSFTAAGGGGIIAGVGIPAFRVLAGFAWQPIRTDRDDDGILDSADDCPSEPEDFDGWFDEDGCPEENNDGDHLADSEDPCPNEGEDVDGFEDEDGCPDPDNDGDRIPDGYDSCLNEPEDWDDDRDEDGCPDHDSDRDGVPDAVDQCVDDPEDTDGFGDTDGCPEDDYDQDGILDVEDECPGEPETINRRQDDDGCPD